MAGTKMSGRRGKLAENVKRLRLGKPITIGALAQDVGVAPSAIYAIESGSRRRLTPWLAARLARVLGVRIEDLVR